jgi:hypothetical protein
MTNKTWFENLLLVIGVTVQWPSWFAMIWIVLYGVIGHWMVITEEEHLRLGWQTYVDGQDMR